MCLEVCDNKKKLLIVNSLRREFFHFRAIDWIQFVTGKD